MPLSLRFAVAAVLVLICGNASAVSADDGDTVISGNSLSEAFAIIQQAVEEGNVPGAIALVLQNGNLVRQEAFGLCDLEEQRPMQTDTICWLASITKPVTAAAAMTLVENGRLSLDDTVDQYLPGFAELKGPDGQPARVTIRQLMSHCSGISASPPLRPRNFFAQGWLGRRLDEIAPLIAEMPLEFEPGQQVQYSNAAPYVLGRIIELRSGRPFGEYVQESILTPLGMQQTYFALPPAKAARIAVVYRRRQEEQDTFFRFDPEWTMTMTMPDGGLFAPPADVARFTQMFLNPEHSPLSQSSVKQMLSEQAPGWGLGWSLGSDGSFEHTGSAGTLTWGDPRSGVVGVLFFQIQDRGTVQPLRDAFRHAVTKASDRT